MASSSSSSCIDQVGGDHRIRVIDELSRGRDTADRLRLLLRGSGLDLCSSSPSVHNLVAKILNSFTQSISLLSPEPPPTDDTSSDVPIRIISEGSGDSCKKDRRGCHKRKRSSTETWTKESSSWPEDNYCWRKYGQKQILDAKHPRNYFRCTHKYDEGCLATKQVQKIQDDPPVFRATYHSIHTCTTSTTTLTTSSSLHTIHGHPNNNDNISSTIIWTFQHQHQPPPLPPIKIKSSPSHNNNNHTRDDGDYYVSDLDAAANCTGHHGISSISAGPGSGSESDHGDVVYSCSPTTHTFDDLEEEMEEDMGSVLGDFLHLD